VVPFRYGIIIYHCHVFRHSISHSISGVSPSGEAYAYKVVSGSDIRVVKKRVPSHAIPILRMTLGLML